MMPGLTKARTRNCEAAMTTLTFPFWIINQRRDLLSLPVQPAGTPGYVAAFSDAQKATAFMVGRGETSWEFKLVSRSSLASLLIELRLIGMRGLCLDPDEHGGGTAIDFDQMEVVA